MSKEFESGSVSIGPPIEEIPVGPDGKPLPFCGVSEIPPFDFRRSLVKGEPPIANTVNFCLDRQSFLDRNWSEGHLGAWNNGNTTERRGLFLSMFYALQNWHPDDPGHQWNEQVGVYDRGLGAHIDYWKKRRCGRSFRIVVWDHLVPANGVISIAVVGRNSGEHPFEPIEGNPCGKRTTLGCFDSRDLAIYIRADQRFSLGNRITDRTYIQNRANITYVIAHEAGHFFRFNHVNREECIMAENLPDAAPPNLPRWQYPADPMIAHFEWLGGEFCGEN